MLKQIWSISAMNFRSITSRLGLSLVIVFGLAGVVGVLTSLLAMSRGFEAQLKATGRNDRAMVMRGGSDSELSSVMDSDSQLIVKLAPGVRKNADGQPMASSEMVLISELPSKARGGSLNVTLRGVDPMGLLIRPEVKIVEGRMFKPGLREVVVGKGALGQFDGASVGAKLRIRGSDWDIVGVFDSGDAHNSELWTDLGTVQSAYDRGNSSSIVIAQLENEAAFDVFKKAVKADPRTVVDIQREQAYYSEQTKNFRQTIGVLAGVISVLMGLGASFAALNTMYAAVSARIREIATLRAIGFSGIPVAISVVLEAMLLAVLGGILGAAIAYLLFNNYAVSTLGQGFTQIVFSFKVTPDLLVLGVIIALFIGFVGGVLPAIRAARVPVTDALRGA
jgi:putative ABC transport system permease protein